MKGEIKIKSFYKWWKNPIRWWKDRKKVRLMTIIANRYWENGDNEEVSRLKSEVLFYGTAIMKNGERINYQDFFNN